MSESCPCPEVAQKVVTIQEIGAKGDQGDQGDQGAQGDPGPTTETPGGVAEALQGASFPVPDAYQPITGLSVNVVEATKAYMFFFAASLFLDDPNAKVEIRATINGQVIPGSYRSLAGALAPGGFPDDFVIPAITQGSTNQIGLPPSGTLQIEAKAAVGATATIIEGSLHLLEVLRTF